MHKPVCLVALLLSATAFGQTMTAHYIDVGQGDATLLEFPCGAILIDAGGQDEERAKALKDYLTSFFERRSDLKNTLESVIITHQHIDHTLALEVIVKSFTIKRYIDNGSRTGSGAKGPNWLRKEVEDQKRDILVKRVTDADVRAAGKVGLTNEWIDPIECDNVDPRIRFLSGGLDKNPGWPANAFANQNNHSISIRVDFGRASYLFTGDLEDIALNRLLKYYAGTRLFDVDIMHVGHHGSHNATTENLVNAVTPAMAVISVGDWDYGKGGTDRFTTWYFGHPRASTIDILTEAIRARRTAVDVMLATKPKRFQRERVEKRIYATAWDGTTQIRATTKPRYTVLRGQQD